jgi:hypothetical protein
MALTDFSGAFAPPNKLKPKSIFAFDPPTFDDDSSDLENTHTTGESPTNAAYLPPGSRPTSNPTGVMGPSLGQQTRPDLVKDIYSPRLNEVTDKLESAYAPPQVGGFRKVLGTILSRKHPEIGGLLTGESQREERIKPLQQEYGLLSNAIGAQQKTQLGDAAIAKDQANTDYLKAETQAKLHPNLVPKEEEWSVVSGAEGPNGEPLQQEKHSGQVRVAPLPGASRVSKSGDSAAKITYDAGIPVSVSGADKKTYDINDPNLPKELQPLVQSAKAAHQQHIKEQEGSQMRVQGAAAAQQARTFAQQEKMFQERQDAPTAATKSMIEAVPKVKGLISRLRPLVDKEVQGSGPLGARWSDFWNNKAGVANPEYNKMRVDDGLLATALMKMHVGSRGGEQMMQHFTNLLGLAHQSPQNYKAALDELDEYANSVGAEGHGGPNPSNLKSSGGAAPVNAKDPLGIL